MLSQSPESAPRRARPPHPPGDGGRRVLVVEDNLDTVHTLCHLLRTMGHEVEYAINGYVAIDLARAFRPEVVLLDIGLPGMGGCEVARTLRGEMGAKVHIYAVTAYGSDEDRKATRAAGCERHLVKPLDPEDLEALLQE